MICLPLVVPWQFLQGGYLLRANKEFLLHTADLIARRKRMLHSLAHSYHQPSPVLAQQKSPPWFAPGMEQRTIFYGYTLCSYSQRCRKVQCTYCASGVNWSAIVTQISSQHPFYPLERQMEVRAAPLFPPGLAVCPKCRSEQRVTNFYTADAVQMATPAQSSKKVENLLHNNCHLLPKATV